MNSDTRSKYSPKFVKTKQVNSSTCKPNLKLSQNRRSVRRKKTKEVDTESGSGLKLTGKNVDTEPVLKLSGKNVCYVRLESK